VSAHGLKSTRLGRGPLCQLPLLLSRGRGQPRGVWGVGRRDSRPGRGVEGVMCPLQLTLDQTMIQTFQSNNLRFLNDMRITLRWNIAVMAVSTHHPWRTACLPLECSESR